mmetsp:Transcript_56343/g.129258  ORF Transcript_56343/g.129258 Transcript_56343/m.129258 type:complete len:522 (-) Transcript_56343:62-1627(-)
MATAREVGFLAEEQSGQGCNSPAGDSCAAVHGPGPVPPRCDSVLACISSLSSLSSAVGGILPRRPTPLLHDQRGNVVVFGTTSQQIFVRKSPRAELGLPAVVLLVEITKLESCHMTEITEHLHRGDVVTLGTLQLHVRIRVLARLESQAPSVEVRATEHDSMAVSALLATVRALLDGRWLGAAAGRASAVDGASLRAVAAVCTALRPLANSILTPTEVLAFLRGCRLGAVAVSVVPRRARDRSGAGAFPTDSGAGAPGVGVPFAVSETSFAGTANCLVVSLRWQRRLRIHVAFRRLLANHLAIRLRTFLGLLALPITNRIRTHTLALQAIVAKETALRLFASCCALWGLAVQSLPTLTNILGAEHAALRGVALHVAASKLILTKLRAPRLTIRSVAVGLTILLANRLRAVPSAVRQTTETLIVGNELPMGTSRLSWHVILLQVSCVANHSRRLHHIGTLRRFWAFLGCGGVQVIGLLLGQLNRHPDIACCGLCVYHMLCVHHVSSSSQGDARSRCGHHRRE